MLNDNKIEEYSIKFIAKYLETCEVSSAEEAETALVKIISVGTKALADNTGINNTLDVLEIVENALIDYGDEISVEQNSVQLH